MAPKKPKKVKKKPKQINIIFMILSLFKYDFDIFYVISHGLSILKRMRHIISI
ncbi:hypothetical protein SKL01_06820 [Staphylococcus kloosii]|uniref:Uncharacterized protein n=1 Tax=Staphylococcus kloosii TaxID=29384 RepID=A0ABQ0XK50_9STAP|nr:hypothetical protein SKL01_06820 [Staphylococcus kloosii]